MIFQSVWRPDARMSINIEDAHIDLHIVILIITTRIMKMNVKKRDTRHNDITASRQAGKTTSSGKGWNCTWTVSGVQQMVTLDMISWYSSCHNGKKSLQPSGWNSYCLRSRTAVTVWNLDQTKLYSVIDLSSCGWIPKMQDVLGQFLRTFLAFLQTPHFSTLRRQ